MSAGKIKIFLVPLFYIAVLTMLATTSLRAILYVAQGSGGCLSKKGHPERD